MIDAYILYDDYEAMSEMLDELANPAYKLSKDVLGDDFVTLTDELIQECY